MPDPTLEEARAAVETWLTVRVPLAAKFSQDGLRRFVETNDAQARKLIAAFGQHNPEFYDALVELATVAGAILERRKVFVDGQDKTPTR